MHKLTVLSFFVVGLMLTIHGTALSQETAELQLLMDLGSLDFKITNTETVDRIRAQNTTLSSKQGCRIVIVTLEGAVVKPCRIMFRTSEFAAVYEIENTNTKGGKKLIGSETLSAFKIVGMPLDWEILPERASSFVSTNYIYDSGTVTFNVAFMMPEEVTTFYVRYPTTAKGKAVIIRKQDGNSEE